MALWYTGIPHDTATLANKTRDIERIKKISEIARMGGLNKNIHILSLAVFLTYQEQLKDGMQEVPYLNSKGILAAKYCGSGHGGYVLYIFETQEDRDNHVKEDKNFISIEPYCRLFGEEK